MITHKNKILWSGGWNWLLFLQVNSHIFSVGKEAKLGKAPRILDTLGRSFLGRRREPIFIQHLFIW